jgi:hypothetical protein
MANGIQKCPNGPFWPLGNIAVSTPGTPVNMMSIVDPNLVNAPSAPTPGTVGANEYTVRCQQIIIQGMKSNAGSGLTNNTGNIYIIQKGPASGSNNRTDTGAIIITVSSGLTAVIASAPMNRNVFNPYLLYVDADNALDGAQVTLIIE